MLPHLYDRFDALERQRAALLRRLGSLDAAQLEFRPGPRSWSIVGIVDHLVLLEREILRQAVGREHAGRRKPSGPGRFGYLKVRLALGIGMRVNVPAENLVPRAGLTLDTLCDEWTTLREELRAYLDRIDSDRLSEIAYLHPIGGAFDVAETLWFIERHLDHHLEQIERVRAAKGFPATHSAPR